MLNYNSYKKAHRDIDFKAHWETYRSILGEIRLLKDWVLLLFLIGGSILFYYGYQGLSFPIFIFTFFTMGKWYGFREGYEWGYQEGHSAGVDNAIKQTSPGALEYFEDLEKTFGNDPDWLRANEHNPDK